MVIVVVDNGRGNDVSEFLKLANKVVAPKNAVKEKANGYILSDGDPKNLEANLDILEKAAVPVLGIATGCLFIGTAFGGEVSKLKRLEKQESVSVKKPCPLTLDMKRTFAVLKSCQYGFNDLPENFDVIAASRTYEFEIIQDRDNPFFGVQFNPELGMDGRKILDNFERFVEVWEKYHE